jgi:RHS repeat-associated protein
VFAWYVKSITDPDGNQIQYTYTQANGMLYVERIEYDLSTKATVTDVPYVSFKWSKNPSPQQTSYKKGYRAVWDARKLDLIEVGVQQQGVVAASRQYKLIYGAETSGSIHGNMTSFKPESLPDTRFEYESYSTQFDQIGKIPLGESFKDWQHNLSVIRLKNTGAGIVLRTVSMLIDVDGDGDLDLLFVESSKDDPRVKKLPSGDHRNEWYWRENIGGTWASKDKQMNVPLVADASALRVEHQIGISTTTTARVQEVFDIDGNGKPDLVFVQSGKIYVCKGTGSGFNSPATVWNSPTDVDLKEMGLGHTWRTGDLSWDDAALLDVNGDGLRDYVLAKHGPPMLAVYANSGYGFSSNPDFTISMTTSIGLFPAYAIRAAEYAINGDGLVRDLLDMNGDGLLDLVESLGDEGLTICYGFGTGSGFDFNNKLVFSAGSISLSLSDLAQKRKQTVVGIRDINGDGLPDIVGYYNGDCRVYLNTGASFTPQQPWKITSMSGEFRSSLDVVVKGNAKNYYGQSDSDEYIGVKQTIVDFDGDGQVELLSVPDSLSAWDPTIYFAQYKQNTSGQWEVDMPGIVMWQGSVYFTLKPPAGHASWFNSEWFSSGTRAVPSHKLHKVTAGSGVTTSLVYGRPHTDKSETPFPLQPLTIVVHHDLATDDHRATYLESYNPQYDHVRKEFRGYESVFEDQGNLRVVEHHFRQNEYDQGIEDTYAIRDYKGTLLQTVTRGIVTTPYAGSSRAWARINEEKTIVLDPDGFTRESLTAYEDDPQHGVVTKVIYHDLVHDGNEDRVDRFDYYVLDPPDCSKYMLRKKWQIRENRQGVVATRTDWQYDGQCVNPASPLTEGRICSQTLWRGQGEPPAVTQYDYDSLGRVITETDPDQIKTIFTYHAFTPHRKSSINALGHTVLYEEYHVLSGQPQRTRGPQSDKSGYLRTDFIEYDLYGRPVKTQIALDDLATGKYVVATVTEIQYVDEGGRLKPTHVIATHFPDPVTQSLPIRKVEVYYDGAGRVIKHGHTCGAKWSATYFAYNWFGNLARAWLPVSETTGVGFQRPPLGPHGTSTGIIAGYSYYHDLLSRPVESMGPEGVEVIARYRGDEIWITDARSYTTHYKMSAFDDIQSVGQTVGGVPLTTSFSYDAAGRLIEAKDPDNAVYAYAYYGDGSVYQAKLPVGTWTYSRTPGGRIDHINFPDGSTLGQSYDQLGRLKNRLVKPGPGPGLTSLQQQTQFVYDQDSTQLGRLTGVQGDGYSLQMHYDSRGNLVEKVLKDENTLETISPLSYQKRFSALGDLLQVKYPSGRTVTYGYDSAGYLESASDSGNGTLSCTLSYDIDGKLNSIKGKVTPAGGSSQGFLWNRTFQYDRKRRLTQLDSSIAVTPWKIEYEYDNNNNIRRMKDSLRGLHYQWFYDEANRLFEAQGYATTAGAYKYSYNKNGSLQAVVENGNIVSYSYTDSRNYLLKSIGSGSQMSTYSSDPATGNRWSSSAGTIKVCKYTWTGDGLLASMEYTSGPASYSTQYHYDHDNIRWKSIHQGITNLYCDDLIEYDSATGAVLEYLHLPGIKCRLSGSQPGEYSFMDMMSVAAVFNDQGVLRQLATYEPYGQRIMLSGTEPMTFDFNGKRREAGAELLYYGTRYLDSATRQWLSPDPVCAQRANDRVGSYAFQPFTYADGNPTTQIDPLGLQPKRADSSASVEDDKPRRSVTELAPNAPLDPRYVWVFPPETLQPSATKPFQLEVIIVGNDYQSITGIAGHAALIIENPVTRERTPLSWAGDFDQPDLAGRYVFSGRSLVRFTYSLPPSEGKSVEAATKAIVQSNLGWCSRAVRNALMSSETYRRAEPWFAGSLWVTPRGLERLLDYINWSGSFRYQSREFLK